MKKIRINENRIELFEIIYSFKFISLKTLAKIAEAKGIYKYIENLRKTIRILEEAKYLKSFPAANDKKFIFLAPKGERVLLSKTEVKEPYITQAKMKNKPAYETLYQTQKLCNLYVEILNEIHKSDLDLKINRFIGYQNLNFHYNFMNIRYGRLIRRLLHPHALLEVEVNNQKQIYFLEYWESELKTDEIAERLRRYFEYLAYGNWREYFKDFPALILYIDVNDKTLSKYLKKDNITLDSSLNNRKHFIRGRNILWKALGRSDNIRSINSTFIHNFLNLEIKFTNKKENILKILTNEI